VRERRSVVIAGALAQKPHQAGHSWQFLQYLLGFRQLGWDVLFVDWLSPEMCAEPAVNVEYFRSVMREFGFAEACSLLGADGEAIWGLSRSEVIARTKSASFLLNVMGYLVDAEILGSVKRRVFLDTDPGFGQVWRELGLADLFKGHDDFVTIAENIGQPQCSMPTCGLKWITWRQPIVLREWPSQPAPAEDAAFTSIGSWRGPYGPLEFQGKTYGLRVHEFRKYLDLPLRVAGKFEVALDIDAAESKDLAALQGSGWNLADPKGVARNPDVYRSYIQNSKAEFMATKGIYVHMNTGWFSERSICYLASGRPVLAQDTSIGHLYPTDEGIVTFSTLDEAIAGVESINANYARHSKAARAIAKKYFDSDKVLADLLAKLEIS
jgi:hypothetical protein